MAKRKTTSKVAKSEAVAPALETNTSRRMLLTILILIVIAVIAGATAYFLPARV